MIRKSMWFLSLVAALCLASPVQAQFEFIFARFDTGVRPGCPFDCDSVTLVVEGDLSSTAWTIPAVTGVTVDGFQVVVDLYTQFNPDATLPVLVPFALEIPLGELPRGAYDVTYQVMVDNPMATMPVIPVYTVYDQFRVAQPGDQNCDLRVDVLDVVTLILQVFFNTPPPDPAERADVTCDGWVNALDLIQIIDYVFFGGDVCDPCEPVTLIPMVQITPQPPEQLPGTGCQLIDATVVGDTLVIVVVYSGGCMDHRFDCFMSPPLFAESVPVQADLYPRHTDPGDPCDAWITETLKFNLRSVADLYFLFYHRYDPIDLNVFADDPQGTVRIRYTP